MLKPAMTVGLVLAIISGLKTFDQVWVLTQGGPGTSTHTMSTFIYLNAFVLGKYGYATAAAVVLTVLTMAFALVQVKFLGGKGKAS
jgi:raffinose/stachyose/melibiose transport system permease protein